MIKTKIVLDWTGLGWAVETIEKFGNFRPSYLMQRVTTIRLTALFECQSSIIFLYRHSLRM